LLHDRLFEADLGTKVVDPCSWYLPGALVRRMLARLWARTMSDSMKHRQRIRVLLVEDNPADARLVREMLADTPRQAYAIAHASSAADALQMLGRETFDCMLLDLHLPDSRGIETYWRFRLFSQDVALLILSGMEDEEKATRAVREGAQGYLVKGDLHGNLLRREISHAMERHSLIRKTASLNEQLTKHDERLRRLIQQNADGMVVVNHDGIVRFVNPAAAALLGRDKNELLNRPFGYSHYVVETPEIEIVHHGGEKCYAAIHAVAIEWKQEQATLLSLHDVTERKRMLKELEHARDEQLRLKDQLLSSVSHELRSPLAAIHQFLTIVLDGLAGEVNPDQREYLGIALRNVDQLGSLISDLLEMTRLEAGTQQVDVCCTRIDDVLDGVIAGMAAEAEKAGIVLGRDGLTAIPRVVADPARVGQVLRNLLDNAIKFTPPGGTITVRSDVEPALRNELCISVADTGCGIPEAEQAHVFEHLYQASTERRASRQGLGLGLFICQQLVRKQGGHMWLESEVGSGSTFAFTLPVFSLESELSGLLKCARGVQERAGMLLVEVFPSSKRRLRREDRRALQELRDVLERALVAETDVLLPKISHPDWGECYPIVSVGSRAEQGALEARIRRQLDAMKELELLGLSFSLSADELGTEPAVGRATAQASVCQRVRSRLEAMLGDMCAEEVA